MSGRFGKLEMRQRSTTELLNTDQVLGTPVRTPEHDLALAESSRQSGHFESALQMFTRSLRDDRGLIVAWVGQVQMLVELGEYPEARLWADKALELFRNNGDLLAAKAQACLRQGDASAAIVCSDASLQSIGSSALRWRVRGEVFLHKAADRARDCFEKSLIEPGEAWFSHISIARVYLFHGLSAAALPYAQMGMELRPSSPYTWLVLGRCQEALGMNTRAGVSYTRSMQLPGGQADASVALRSLNHIGRFSRAGRWLRGLLKR